MARAPHAGPIRETAAASRSYPIREKDALLCSMRNLCARLEVMARNMADGIEPLGMNRADKILESARQILASLEYDFSAGLLEAAPDYDKLHADAMKEAEKHLLNLEKAVKQTLKTTKQARKMMQDAIAWDGEQNGKDPGDLLPP